MDSLIEYHEGKDRWLGIDTLEPIDFSNNPLFSRDPQLEELPGLRELAALRDPRYMCHWTHAVLGMTLPPYQMVIQRELWEHAFPMFIGTRGLGKTSGLALFSLMYALLVPNSKVVLAGASFRQSKMIFEYIEKIWSEAPMLRSMCRKGDGAKKGTDRWLFTINSSTITAIPIGPSGEKIRGLRANVTICDEFAAHNPTIVEEVIFGFGAVQNNPVQNIKREAFIQYLKEQGVAYEEPGAGSIEQRMLKNKSIIAGTADYYFNHFYDYWNRYRSIIQSQGDPETLEKIFNGEIPEAFDWRDFSVIRIPYSLLPKGFMADEVIARAKSQMTKSLYLKEYEAIFVEDSDGFFKRSLIEMCVAKEKNIPFLKYCDTPFEVAMSGDSKKEYVIGVDPAAKDDNFAIIVLEVYEEHNRVVHCWTTNEKDFKARQKAGSTQESDYYSFCCRKIRELVKAFPTSALGIDAQGGGLAIIERLKDTSVLKPGELPFYEFIDYDNRKPTDTMAGQHIIHPIEFSKHQWLTEANWGLRGDMESRQILFPNFDALTTELSIMDDKKRVNNIKSKLGDKYEVVIFDSIEDTASEIEELKDELTNIVYSKTASGRERWDVPEVITDRNKKVSGKKDRYSALIIANSLARYARVNLSDEGTHHVVGGLAREVQGNSKSRKSKNVWELYQGGRWK